MEQVLDADRIRDLETCEREAWADFFRAAPEPSASEHGIAVKETAGGLLARAAATDVLALNRVLGLGDCRPASPGDIDEIVREYRESGARRFFVQISPIAEPSDLADRLEDRGFLRYNNWVKLQRDTAAPAFTGTQIEVRPIEGNDADAFGRIVSECFGWPDWLGPWVARTVGRPGWKHYMAFDGAEAVATGAFFVWRDLAWLDFAATLPQHRGRGAQSALLARRIDDAREAGCHALVVETAEQTAARGAPSWRNTVAFGFRQAYLRPNFVRVLRA